MARDDEPTGEGIPDRGGAPAPNGVAGTDTGGLIDHLFRHEGAALVAHLTRWLGPRHLDLAEEAVQDALVGALRTWPNNGIPANPAGWLHRVARNRAIDLIRRREPVLDPSAARDRAIDGVAAPPALPDDLPLFDPDEVPGEDRLRLLLLCCHPDLPRRTQVTLALRYGAGLGSREIARAFREPVATTQQRLVRARRRLSGGEPDDDSPLRPGDPRVTTLRAVLLAIYNEGYLATEGDLTRADLIAEAIRLTDLLATHPAGDEPRTHALLAMMLLQSARLPARVDGVAGLVELARQDRGRWDDALLRRGYFELARAMGGDHLSDEHLLAEIAACHALPDPGQPTPWARIVACYDTLIERASSPVLVLNRAVARAAMGDLSTARRDLDGLRDEAAMARYHLFHAVDADLAGRAMDREAAIAAWRRAAALATNDAERAHIARKLAKLDVAPGAPGPQAAGSGAGTDPSGVGSPSLVT